MLRGNIALDGCVVKTAGVDDSLLVFEGPAHVVESQDEAVENILGDKVKAGDIVVVRYEGPCLLYTSPSPRDRSVSRMPSSA